jgi:phage major head subunit gpT-like protein
MEITAHNLQTLETSFHAHYQRGFNEVPTDYLTLADVVPSSTGENEYGWLGDWPGMREWIDERYVHALAEHGYTLKNKRWENTVGVERIKIADDQFGIYAPRFVAQGRATGTHPNVLTYQTLAAGFTTTKAYDGKPLFAADHPFGAGTFSNIQSGSDPAWFLVDLRQPIKPLIFQEREKPEFQAFESPDAENVFMRDQYLYGVRARYNVGVTFPQLVFGSKAALTETNLKDAITTMSSYTNERGEPLGIMPTHLIVGASNRFAARKIILGENKSGGESNELRGVVELMESRWIA